MKQILNALIVFMLMIAALNVTGQDQAKAEQVVKNYLSGKYTNYTAGYFGDVFEIYQQYIFTGKIEKFKEIKYSLTHNYSLGKHEYEMEYFYFDKDYNLLGQLPMDTVLKLGTKELMEMLEMPEDYLGEDTIIIVENVDYSLNPHIGLWFDGESYLKLEENGLCEIIMPDLTMGGENYVRNGEKIKVNYVVDYNTSPVSIDIIVSSANSGQEIGRALGILLFINYNRMKLRLNFSESGRPKDFLPVFSSDVLVLRKVTK